MIIIKIIAFSLAWLILGFFTTLIIFSNPKIGHLNKDGEYDYDDEDYYRFIFSIVLWPIALIIKIIKFIIYLLYALWVGFKEEIKK